MAYGARLVARCFVGTAVLKLRLTRMSIIPFTSFPLPPPFPTKPSKPFRFPCNPFPLSAMVDEALKEEDSTNPKPSNYPIPLSPPLPAISKQIELSRAMSASSISSTYSLSPQDVIFEDEWLLVVNKPQGVYCENVLSSILPFLTANSATPIDDAKSPELHLANRLDRDTSGLMVITKSNKVAGRLVKAFTDHKIMKTYIALSIGSAPKWEKISLMSGHGRSKFGVWRVYAASDVGRTLPGGSVVRDMATTFEVLSVNGRGGFREPATLRPNDEEFVVIEDRGVVCSDVDMKDEVLVRAYPRSGRTHQIRLHCQYLGVPIRGDVKYEGVYDWEGKTFDGHALHAETLVFEHPVTGHKVKFCAPLPSWANQAIQSLLEEG